MNLVEKALDFANRAHAGMVRKSSKLPYIMHPMEAAVIAASVTDDECVVAAALLHDVVEDAGVTLVELEREFGARVADLVASETEYKRAYLPARDTWMMRKQEAVDLLNHCDDIAVKQLYLGDKLSNLRSLYRGYQAEGDAFWQHFNQTDPEKHHWYYRSICNAIADLSDSMAWQELDCLIGKLFHEGEAPKGV